MRDATTKAWTDATDFIAVPSTTAKDNSYQALEIDCSAKKLTGFDAFRMVDGLGKYNPRYVELDAIAGLNN